VSDTPWATVSELDSSSPAELQPDAISPTTAIVLATAPRRRIAEW
jgi:hypothetical protein